MKLGIVGRSETFQKLSSSIQSSDNVIWFHCASLGEYEQGFPLFEVLRVDYPNHKIVLSFFSPSGYEVKKHTSVADIVVYLPFDTKGNAKRFIDMINPELTIFVKYEIWPNYLEELKKRELKTLLISALFRKDQLYFKWYGNFMKHALESFDHIFTQDRSSKDLLASIGITDVSVSGDTRFDRVSKQLEMNNTLDFISSFKQSKLCFVAGSTWPADENILIPYINSELAPNTKVIIAPHNIKKEGILKLKNAINKEVVLYSEKEGKDVSQYDVFILDTIGLLSKVYSYADIAYIGGAMGSTGLHNTLEAAAFGIPIVIGKHYDKFPEAKSMIENKGMFSVTDQVKFNTILQKLTSDPEYRKSSGKSNADYVEQNKGAVIQILNYIRK
ncbi:glycosyltransferase N-terminal domain-containing protein [Winogradskyella sp. 3972H.M.0a.05]|uniref:3-deoxy-D-manno-octulosonic acid transferase n=1 Tax=Winogradskyella sp. 3972H.M.0a.05 TaxID=2950277 RepID=UPI00339941C2